MSAHIWVVDDDESIRWVLARALERQNWRVTTYSRASDALASLAAAAQSDLPNLLISDIRMPGVDGLSLLTQVKEQYPQLPIIITTAYSDLNTTVAAFAKGAFEYLPKPVDLPQLIELVKRALPANLEPDIDLTATTSSLMTQLIGQSSAIQEVYRMIGRLSQTTVTVLITGESGTGKELVARALHEHSARAKGPFIAINTAAIPSELLESELFGHEKGAFTGAQQQRLGRFEQAAGGTLFLDEIGDMPYPLQTRLLRVLSDGTFYRVGGQHPIKTNVRLIAATHQHLEALVVEKKFREDLLHRLNVIRIHLPALRERREDIPMLFEYFLQQQARELNVSIKTCTPAALEKIVAHRFSGNVRELENLCRWLMVMTASQTIEISDLPAHVLQQNDVSEASGEQLGLSHRVSDEYETLVEARFVDKKMISHVANVDTKYAIDDANVVADGDWQGQLSALVRKRLEAGDEAFYTQLLDQFESTVLETGLRFFQGRRGDTAKKLGIGRNTITRKLGK